MARGKRGGQRTPRNPAAVSGVGAASARTDGGPGSIPPLVANQQGYGVRAATEAAAGAAPMYDESGQGAPSSPPAQRAFRPVTPGPAPSLHGPATMPDVGAGMVPPEQEVLKAIYRAYPSPWIASLIGDDF